jgi:hypothetical protein
MYGHVAFMYDNEDQAIVKNLYEKPTLETIKYVMETHHPRTNKKMLCMIIETDSIYTSNITRKIKKDIETKQIEFTKKFNIRTQLIDDKTLINIINDVQAEYNVFNIWYNVIENNIIPENMIKMSTFPTIFKKYTEINNLKPNPNLILRNDPNNEFEMYVANVIIKMVDDGYNMYKILKNLKKAYKLIRISFHAFNHDNFKNIMEIN